MFKPFGKNQRIDSDSSGSDSEGDSPKTQKIEKKISDSDIEEINPSQYEPATPDVKNFKGSLQSNHSEYYGNKELKAIFDEFMPTLENSDKKFINSAQKEIEDEIDKQVDESVNSKSGILSWAKTNQVDHDEKIEANCVKVFNLHSKVCNRVLWELFSKVGRIKRLTLYRIKNSDIESSFYLKSLNLDDESTRPHKKRAEIEYQAPNYAKNAVEVFDGLSLYNKKIYVYKTLDDSLPKAKICINPISYPWLDEYFCLDYFTRFCDIVRVLSSFTESETKITIVVPEKNDLKIIDEKIQSDLINYAAEMKVNYIPKINITRDDRREMKSMIPPEKKKAKLLDPSNEDGFVH